MDGDPYFHKIVPLRHEGGLLRLRVSQALFSSYEVDTGTRFLLRSLAGIEAGSVLDLGCGYGPIGLALKQSDPARTVHMVDRDALAVHYARQNAALNGLSGIKVHGSLGYDDVTERDFDLIASNIPAKAGEQAISSFLLDARRYLAPGGLVAVVVVAPLAATVQEILERSIDARIVFTKAKAGQVVFHYRFAGERPVSMSPGDSVERGVYDRSDATITLPGVDYRLVAAHGLPESDSPSHATRLLIDALRDLDDLTAHRALVFSPGQGHVPIALWRLGRPSALHLVDRDLLALRCARRNLLLNGCSNEGVSISHQVGLAGDADQPFDLIAGVLREDEGPAGIALAAQQASHRLAPGGLMLLAGGSTAASRLTKRLHGERLLRVEERKRQGAALLVLRH